MRFSIARLFLLVAAPVVVLACEGDCIVGITNAFVTNYTDPVDFVLGNVVNILRLLYAIGYISNSLRQNRFQTCSLSIQV